MRAGSSHCVGLILPNRNIIIINIVVMLVVDDDDDDDNVYQYHFLLPHVSCTLYFFREGLARAVIVLYYIVLNAHCLLRDARASPKL